MAREPKPNSQDRQVEFGDTVLTLRLGIRAMLALKDLWQCENDAALEKRLGQNQLDDVVDVLWAACLTHHRDMTRDDMLSIVDDAGINGLGKELKSLIEASSPPPDENPQQVAG